MSRPGGGQAGPRSSGARRGAGASRLEAAFVGVFPSLRPALRARFDVDGVLLAVARADGSLGVWTHCPLDGEVGFATVGRHPRARPRAGGVERHVLVAARREGGDGLRLRLLDLSGTGLQVAEGLVARRVEAEGSLLVGLGDEVLLALATGRLADVPFCDEGAAAWAALPERRYRDRGLGDARAGSTAVRRTEPPVAPPSERTVTNAAPRVGRAGSPLRLWAPPPSGHRGAALGTIELVGREGAVCHALEAHAAERGILVGRDERCAIGASDPCLSGVHLAIVEIGGTLWLVDTASHNGTWEGARRVEVQALRDAVELGLGSALRLRFRPHDASGA